MESIEKLKKARNILVKLHKSMIDLEREMYEGIQGKVSAAEFVNLLMEDDQFVWLRKFSMLIAEIDEMFDVEGEPSADLVEANLAKVNELVGMKDPDEYFRAKYQFALQRDLNSVALHAELKMLFK